MAASGSVPEKPKYKLYYFNVHHIAEPIRFLFAIADIPFEDLRFEYEDWASLKQNTPFGQVPILDFHGKQAHQSIAICRYVARQAQLDGKDDWENLEIDAIVHTVLDFLRDIQKQQYESNPKYGDARREPHYDETIKRFYSKFNDIVKDNSGYFIRYRLTWADIYFVGLLEYIDFLVGKDTVANYPNLKELKEHILDMPKIKEYLAKRPAIQ